jgi:ketosteroid isomerase-like protein
VVDDVERKRRHDLLAAHLGAENRGDIAGIMQTFSVDAVMNYNAAPFPNPEAIKAAHMYMGFSQAEGAFKDARNLVDRESFTDTDIIVEGRLCGVHQGEFLGFKPSGKAVELPFVAIYTFHENGKLTSERVVMNLGLLHEGYYSTPGGS